METETAETKILRLCRKSQIKGMGHPVMRERKDGTCVVMDVDNAGYVMVPPVTGATWEEVLSKLVLK